MLVCLLAFPLLSPQLLFDTNKQVCKPYYASARVCFPRPALSDGAGLLFRVLLCIYTQHCTLYSAVVSLSSSISSAALFEEASLTEDQVEKARSQTELRPRLHIRVHARVNVDVTTVDCGGRARPKQ